MPPPQSTVAAAVWTTDWLVRRLPRGLGAQAALAGAVVVVGYQMAVGDLSVTVHRACTVAVTVFSVSCSFCALALRLRRCWTDTAVYSLFTTCCGVELALGHTLVSMNTDNTAISKLHPQPLLTAAVLTTAGMACALSPLDVVEGVMVVGLVSVARCLASTMLVDIPLTLRPLLIYGGGLSGVLAARFIESALLQNADSGSVVATSSISDVTCSPASVVGKTAEIKRRRASASATNSYSSHAASRRVSLPILVHKSLVCSHCC